MRQKKIDMHERFRKVVRRLVFILKWFKSNKSTWAKLDSYYVVTTKFDDDNVYPFYIQSSSDCDSDSCY